MRRRFLNGGEEKFIPRNYLAFTAEQNNSTIALTSKTSPDIKYSLNGGNWVQWDYSSITLNTGDVVYMKGDNSSGFNTSGPDYNNFKMTGRIAGSGNIMSLLYEKDFEERLIIPREYCYQCMFVSCTSLTKAPELPATTLANDCYMNMFDGCTSLTKAPELPATALSSSCYQRMFRKCTSLTTAPELPATILSTYCYYYMFDGCTKLTIAPQLPATTLAIYCYYGMFRGCTKLAITPELPATTLAKYCYDSMFYNCTSLTIAPQLPATTLAIYCYNNMFRGCTSLTIAPELPATTLASDCYMNMFSGCTSLTTAPELPATELASNCYSYMFYNCKNLTTPPELPATTLDDYCYNCMFYNCTSLTTAPKLPATELEYGCYKNMFKQCYKLNKITMLATDISASSCLYDWVQSVSSTGTFVKHPDMTTLPSGTSGIPSGWTVEDYVEGGGNNLITFTIDSVEFQGESEMTWEEWLETDYNTHDFSTTNSYHVNIGSSTITYGLEDTWVLGYSDGTRVSIYDKIINGYSYIITT